MKELNFEFIKELSRTINSIKEINYIFSIMMVELDNDRKLNTIDFANLFQGLSNIIEDFNIYANENDLDVYTMIKRCKIETNFNSGIRSDIRDLINSERRSIEDKIVDYVTNGDE